jgi:hypothetical protein
MNDETIEDLKQFIQATISQATAGLATQAEMLRRFDELDQKVTAIADAHAESLEDLDSRLGRVETRLDSLT